MLSSVFNAFFNWFRSLWTWLLALPVPLRFCVFLPIAMLIPSILFRVIGRNSSGQSDVIFH